ncbi:MAG: hypothetical protein WCB19_02285 [Thermoplasmata archaeon]
MPRRDPSNPYSNTPVSASKSQEQIDYLLQRFGATGTNWTKLFDKGRIELTFAVRGKGGRNVAVKVVAPILVNKHRNWDPETGKSEVKETGNWAQSMRLLYYYVKAKLEAVRVGLREFEEEFLADTLVQDASGATVRVADLMLPAIEAGGGRLRLEAPKNRDGVVDADYTSSG